VPKGKIKLTNKKKREKKNPEKLHRRRKLGRGTMNLGEGDKS